MPDMPRDPSDLARIAPEALELVNTLDALYALLEAVEERASIGWYDEMPAIDTAAHHARACWDELTRRDSPQEIAALKRIKKCKCSDGTPATIRHYSVSPHRCGAEHPEHGVRCGLPVGHEGEHWCSGVGWE